MKNIIITLITFSSFSIYSQTSEEIEMVRIVNELRANPKSFIQYLEIYIKDKENDLGTKNFSMKVISSKSTANNSGLNASLIYEAKKLILILNNTKPMDTLTFRMDMFVISKSFAKYLVSTKTFNHYKTQERFKPLGILVNENIEKGGKNAINAMLNFMIDSDGENKTYGHRNNILNPKFKSISVANINDIWVQNFAN